MVMDVAGAEVSSPMIYEDALTPTHARRDSLRPYSVDPFYASESRSIPLDPLSSSASSTSWCDRRIRRESIRPPATLAHR